MKKSIITDDMSKCYVCGAGGWIEIHHIFFGSNRAKSDKYGLVVPLCQYHHRGTDGVHGYNGHRLDVKLKMDGQRAFEREHPNDSFLEVFGRNYL